MIKYCITGANGFIGSHLFSKLSERNESPEYIRHQDISKGFDSEKLFFLSTYGNMAHHDNHGTMIRANVADLLITINLFSGWLCYMSSSSVTLQVQTPYSRTKRAAEEILQALPELKSCIVRPYSVFGKNEQPSHLIPTLIRSCFEDEKVNFYPIAVHDWIAVDDVIDALILFAESNATGIFELGTGTGMTNHQVLHVVEKVTGKKANINLVNPVRSYDNQEWWCRESKAWELGWKAQRKFEDTIAEVVEDYKGDPSKYANPKLPSL